MELRINRKQKCLQISSIFDLQYDFSYNSIKESLLRLIGSNYQYRIYSKVIFSFSCPTFYTY